MSELFNGKESKPIPGRITIYHEMANKIASLTAEKNAAYGDSFAKSGMVMELLYPDGVKPEQYKDFLAIIRVIDKLFRIATRKDAFGENPWEDINGYSLLGAAQNER